MTQPAEALPRLAKFDLLEEVGHGGMATVYRARDRRLGREVAVKIIHRHLRESAEVGRRFTVEARAVAKLRHGNIVEIYDVSEDDAAERYLVAELVRGKSMRRVLSEQKTLPAEVTACVVVELCSALAHAHERGVVHRDVKPENVLFGLPSFERESYEGDAGGSEGSEPTRVAVKITDFGIAKVLDQEGVTATGQVLGSPAYMAPEQIEGGDIDQRSDIFALGVLMYESMVGHLPFEGKNPAQVLRRVLEGTFPAADREQPLVGQAFAAIAGRALAHDPPARYPSMIAMRAELDAELRALGIVDTKKEITDYFVDPAGYAAKLPARLVPPLLARGQAAQKAGAVIAAAGHLNRALAFAPTDPLVLAQLGALTRNQAWRNRGRTLGMVTSGGVILVLAAAVTARFAPRFPQRRPLARPFEPGAWVHDAAESIPITADSSKIPQADADGGAPASADGGATSGHHQLAIAGLGAHVGPDGGALREEREVKFILYPPSALAELDGAKLPEDFSISRTLEVFTSHRLRGYVGASNPCCDPTEASFTVQRQPSGSDAPQIVSLSLRLRKATLISEAPAGFQLQCAMLRINSTSAVGAFPVEMQKIDDSATCLLLDGSRPVTQRTVRLKAGETTTIRWVLPAAGAP